MRDLMSLLALPACWARKCEETILQLMTDAVANIVPIAVIFAQVYLPPSHLKVPVLRIGQRPLSRHILPEWQEFTGLCDGQSGRTMKVTSPIGPLAVMRFHMSAGTRQEHIWFGFRQDAFPSQTQTAFLHAAVSLCTAGLNTARIEYELARANRTKDEFLAMLGHELRNPLAPIVTTLALIRLRGSDALAKEHAVIERQVAHLSRLVDDLLDVTRITRGQVDLRLEVFELRAVVLEAVESISPLLEEMEHRITVDIDQLDAALVQGDPQRIRQVLVNLLINAAKYTPPGGTIALTAAQDLKTVSVSIQDNGSGIDADLLPRVFDLFEQGLTTIDRSRGGLGIGLALVKKLVNLHGGVATADSEGAGKGSRFTVSLPLVKPKAGLPSSVLQPTQGHRTEGQRVLIVDDNADALDALEALLTCYGFDVLTARSPKEAIEKAHAFGPDVLILDIGLPEMDGYQLAMELRRLGGHKTQAAKFIALTGYGQDADKERSRAAGFHRHLVKPIEIGDLLDAMVLAGK